MNQRCKITEETDPEYDETRDRIEEVDEDVEGKPVTHATNEELVRKQRAGKRVASGHVTLLETNKAPELRTADPKDILRFQQKREKYERVHFESGADGSQLRSLISMIEPVFLFAICRYQLQKAIEDVTDEDLEHWISGVLRDDRSRDVLLESKMSQLKMRMSIESASARVLALTTDFHRLCKDYGWERLFEGAEGKKRHVKFLLNAVQPTGLKDMMTARVARETQLSKDPDAFTECLQEAAVYYQETSIYQRREAKMNPRNEATPGAGNKRLKSSNSTSFKVRIGTKEEKPEGSAESINGGKGQGKREYPNLRCYECKELGHPIFKCPKNLSKQHVYEVLKKNANKSKQSSNYTWVCHIVASEDSEEVLVRVNNSLYFPAILDSGARGVSLIPRSVAKEAMRNDKSITLQKLSEPVRLKLGDNSSIVEATDFVCVTLRLRTKAGDLITRKRQCLIWDVPSDEIILGSDLLEELGIEPRTALDALILRKRQKMTQEESHEDFKLRYDKATDKFQVARITVNEEINCGLKEMVERAENKGLPKQWCLRLEQLLQEHTDVWRINMGPDGPAKVTPFVTRLLPNARPFRCPNRRYSPEDSEFLKSFIDDLIKNGLIEENPNSQWASPAVVVRKSDDSRRMVVDLRGVNALSESTAWPMPFLEAIVNNLAGSKCWFKLDAFKGFWMMPLAEDCREMFSFMTDRGVYTPRRSIQGALNSATQFQARMSEVFKSLINKHLIVWIDDLLGYGKTLEEWFQALGTTLTVAQRYNIKFNLKKCELFTDSVKFCGRIFTTEGVKHDPKRVEALSAIPHPRNARDLQQFLMAAQWMSRSIPEYNKRVACLQDIFESCMKEQPSRKKSVARQVRLSKYGWQPRHALAFEQLKTAIEHCVQLAYPRVDMIQCVFTDANDGNTSGMVTQIPVEDEDKPIEFQRHEPLGFVGHRFNATERNWSVAEKEGFAIKDTLQKLDYLLQMRRPFKLCCDHKNLISIFSPKQVSKPTAQKLQRWALEMQRFRYEIEHIQGEKNIWADLMTRWGAAVKLDNTQVLAVRRVTLHVPNSVRVRPLQRPDFVWPDHEEIKQVQRRLLSERQSLKTNEDGLYINKNEKIIIPAEAKDLQMRLCVIAHAGGNSGHLGYHATLKKVTDLFWWKNSVDDVRALCKACLHCLPTRGGVRIPRPLGTAVHGTKPNEVVHMDWIYIAPVQKNGIHEYVWNLVLRDDLSGLIKITPGKIPNTEVTVEALMEWRAIFGTPKVLVSDMASYFVSDTMRRFSERCNMRQHITVAYGHYCNGTIEVINKIFLQLMRALLSELRWDKQFWPWLNANIEHTINHRPQDRLNGYAPVTVMTGQPADNPLEQIFWCPSKTQLEVAPLDKGRIKKHIEELQKALTAMHKTVTLKSEELRKIKNGVKNMRRKEPNFTVGDFVLVGDPEPVNSRGQKLFLKWRGPFRITDTEDNYIFEVENILDSTKKWVHGDRVQFYADNQLNVTEEIKMQFAHDNERYQVQAFRGCRRNPETTDLEILVEWKGFSSDENSWEPLRNLFQDVRAKILAYSTQLKKERHELAHEVAQFLKENSN